MGSADVQGNQNRLKHRGVGVVQPIQPGLSVPDHQRFEIHPLRLSSKEFQNLAKSS